MKDIIKLNSKFLVAGEVECQTINADDLNNAYNLIEEEKEEFDLEYPFVDINGANVDNINELKECIDLMYVLAQFMNQSVGPEIAGKMFDAVHANNMDKFPGVKCIKLPSG